MTFVERYTLAREKFATIDPETEPYRSKYEAKEIFQELKQSPLTNIPQPIEEYLKTLTLIEEDQRWRFRRGNDTTDSMKKYQTLVQLILDYHLGTIESETEEKSAAEQRFRSIHFSIVEALPHPLLLSLASNLYNQLILIRTYYEDYDGAIRLAEEFEQCPKSEAFPLDDLIDFRSRPSDVEQNYTHTLFYLAQIYGKRNEKHQSAKFCRMTLERQLRMRNTPSFDAVEWALNCATLSQFYIGEHDYPTARHCLICAESILGPGLDERRASFQRCWIKYAVNLLSDSADRLLCAADRDVHPNEIIRSSSTPSFQFDLPDLPSPPISSTFILDYSQAREVFLFAMKKIHCVASVFILDGFVTDHVEICQDWSQLYNKMIFFVAELDRKCKLHKRRIDLLEKLCQEISEDHYVTLIRQLLFELGECYSQLLDLKVDYNEKRNPKKIQRLATKGIETFERFLRTMSDKKSGEHPLSYAEEYVRPVLLARFYLARLHSKCLEDRAEHLKKSLKEYETILDYVARHPSSKESIEKEYEICREMKELLPLKLEKLR